MPQEDWQMNKDKWLAERFEENRRRLRSVAYRMLGSLSEVDDAVQETWLRLSRSDAGDIDNLTGWLTTVIGRVCLDMLRSRKSRREEPLDSSLPDPILISEHQSDPERTAMLADSVGLALLVVMETLTPAERLAYVLHDIFAEPFDEIAAIVGCSPVAARQLASRARRRIQVAAPNPDADVGGQRKVVNAFLAAVRDGNFDALVAVLDPDMVFRFDDGKRGLKKIRGARSVAREALRFSRLAKSVRPVLVNGVAGIVSLLPNGQPFSVMSFVVRRGKITEIDLLRDPARLSRLDLTILDP